MVFDLFQIAEIVFGCLRSEETVFGYVLSKGVFGTEFTAAFGVFGPELTAAAGVFGTEFTAAAGVFGQPFLCLFFFSRYNLDEQ